MSGTPGSARSGGTTATLSAMQPGGRRLRDATRLQMPQVLQLADLQAAARTFVGEHDFASFGRAMKDGAPGSPGSSTTRVIYRSGWRQEGEMFFYDVIGNAFLRGMVRALVGSMLSVGVGRMTVQQLGATLAAKDRSLAAQPAQRAACA